MDEYNCDICGNSRVILYEKDGYDFAKDCECAGQIKTLQKIEKSGLQPLLNRCTFDSFNIFKHWQDAIKKFVMGALKNEDWLLLLGQSGAGKTHLCTALCGELLKQGKSLRYVRWQVEIKELKRVANSNEYDKLMSEYLNCDVLYIDDFFKIFNDVVTPADKNVAFELVDARLARKNRTIISGEMYVNEMINRIDQALIGRVVEACNGQIHEIGRDATANYRLKDYV